MLIESECYGIFDDTKERFLSTCLIFFSRFYSRKNIITIEIVKPLKFVTFSIKKYFHCLSSSICWVYPSVCFFLQSDTENSTNLPRHFKQFFLSTYSTHFFVSIASIDKISFSLASFDIGVRRKVIWQYSMSAAISHSKRIFFYWMEPPS